MLNIATDATASSGSVSILPIILIWIILALIIYFIPTFVAFKKGHINKTAILILNIFLGWTFIGWVVALIWSIMKKNT